MSLDADSIVTDAQKYAEFHMERAIECAKKLCDARIPYVLGGKKKEEGLDCSGLTRLCYRDLADGVSDQYEQLRGWFFGGKDIACGRPGDLIFFSHTDRPDILSHLGIISQVSLSQFIYSVIEASSVKGYVAEENFDLRSESFGSDMRCKGIVKIYPFLTRQYIKEHLEKHVREQRYG